MPTSHVPIVRDIHSKAGARIVISDGEKNYNTPKSKGL